MNKFVLQYLSQGFTSDAESLEISDALTRFLADKYTELFDIAGAFEANYLDPRTAFPEWLDAIAYWNGWGEIWSKKWKDEYKRKLLINSEEIWRNRGNFICLGLLFDAFDLDADISPRNGFELPVTALPGQLGTDPFSYVIKIKNYQSLIEVKEIMQTITRHFIPCWIYYQVIYE